MTIERWNWWETPLALLAYVGWAVIVGGAIVYAPLAWNLLKWAYLFS